MEIGGIKFAPLKVPLDRRLQTLAAGCGFVWLIFGGLICLILSIYLLLFTRFWLIISIYLAWFTLWDISISSKGGRPSSWVRSWRWWKYMKFYFPATLERLPWVELDPKRNYLFCCFPHGMLSLGVFCCFGNDYGEFKTYFPYHKLHVVTLSQHYIMPFFREMALALGGIAADAKAIDYTLKYPEGGHVTVLMPGGAQESYYCKPGQYRIILKKRKGFIKLALRNGTPLVPVLSFGETDTFDQVEGNVLRKIQEFVRKWIGIAPVVPVGRGFFQYSFGLVPRRKPIYVVGNDYGELKTYFPYHKLHVVTLSQHYIMPFFREMALALGGIAADAKAIDYTLKYPEGGHVTVLMPGGAQESYYCKPGQYRIILKKRKGFIKLALRNGTPLVPVLSFGETDTFDQVEGNVLRKIQEFVRKWIGIAPVVPVGRGFFQYSFGLVPRRKPIYVVVGEPLEVPKFEEPTQEQIDEYHSKFVEHLQNMFESQKYNYLNDPDNTKLIIE